MAKQIILQCGYSGDYETYTRSAYEGPDGRYFEDETCTIPVLDFLQTTRVSRDAPYLVSETYYYYGLTPKNAKRPWPLTAEEIDQWQPGRLYKRNEE